MTSDPAPAPTAEPAPRDLPAGVDPDELAAAPPLSRRRAVLRRRLRYLGRVRELLVRDLGGLVYEIHRTAGGQGTAHHARLVEAKVERLRVLDAEARELAERVGDPTGELVLREPGIGGTCPSCGELHGPTDRFCSHCGTELRVRETVVAGAEPGAGDATPGTGEATAAAPQATPAEAATPAETTAPKPAPDQPTAVQAVPPDGANGIASDEAETQVLAPAARGTEGSR